MPLVSNYRAMPLMLKVMVALGLAAPIVVLASVISRASDSVLLGYGHSDEMSGLVEIAFVVAAASPLCVSAFLMLKRQKMSRVFFLGSWVLVSFSPFFLTSVKQDMDVFWLEFAFNTFLGLILGIYLFYGGKVRKYFRH